MKNLFCSIFLFFAAASFVQAQDFKAGDPIRLGQNEGIITLIKDGKAYVELNKKVERSGKTSTIEVLKLRLETYKLERDGISLAPLKSERSDQTRVSDKLIVVDKKVNYRRGNAHIGAVRFEASVLELFENGYAKIEYTEYTEIPTNMKGEYKQSLPESNIKLVKLSDISFKNITPLASDSVVDFFKVGDDILCTDRNGIEYGGKIEELYKSKDAKVKFTYRYLGDVEQAITESISTMPLADCGGAARDARIASAKKENPAVSSEEKRSVSSEKREVQKKDKRIEYYQEDGVMKVRVIGK